MYNTVPICVHQEQTIFFSLMTCTEVSTFFPYRCPLYSLWAFRCPTLYPYCHPGFETHSPPMWVGSSTVPPLIDIALCSYYCLSVVFLKVVTENGKVLRFSQFWLFGMMGGCGALLHNGIVCFLFIYCNCYSTVSMINIVLGQILESEGRGWTFITIANLTPKVFTRLRMLKLLSSSMIISRLKFCEPLHWTTLEVWIRRPWKSLHYYLPY